MRLFITGTLTGLINSIILNPFWVIKTKLQLDEQKYVFCAVSIFGIHYKFVTHENFLIENCPQIEIVLGAAKCFKIHSRRLGGALFFLTSQLPL